MPRRHGFTLIELLVVIGILAMLTAIIVPMGKRLRESNSTSRCEAQLSHIGRALRAYFLDEGGVPPILVAGTINAGVPTPASDVLVLNTGEPLWANRGLQELFYQDYLGDRQVLHCPHHAKAADGSSMDSRHPEYYQSYINADPEAKFAGTALKQYKYMPYRWAMPDDYENDYRRQLTRNVSQISLGGTAYLLTSRSSEQPPDDTIVTWCNYHADTYRLDGRGQYVVLYWDGSVQLLDQELFRDAGVGRDEAWLTRPTDAAQ